VHRVAIARGMKAASAAAKLTPPVTFHDTRRSYGSLLINAGVPLESIDRAQAIGAVTISGRADLRESPDFTPATGEAHAPKPRWRPAGAPRRRIK
jgi:hypothetical protein